MGTAVFYTVLYTKGYRQQTQITLKRRTKACKCVSLDQIYTTAQALPHGSIYHPSLKLLQRTKQACIPVQHWVTGSILIPLCQGSTPRPPAVRVLSRGCSPSCAQGCQTGNNLHSTQILLVTQTTAGDEFQSRS